MEFSLVDICSVAAGVKRWWAVDELLGVCCRGP